MKVIVKLMGGLGNQMFQYAFGKTISEKTGRELILDISFLENRNQPDGFVYRNYDLDVFNLNVKIISGFVGDCEYINQSWDSLHKIEESVLGKVYNSTSENLYIEGYWQSPKYFENNNYFSEFSHDIEEGSKSLYEEILSSNSLMINMRRGDFVNNSFSGWFEREYVEKSLSLINGKYDKVFIFSDDPEWCQENLSDLGTVIGHEHSGFKFSTYLRLMSACKYFIIPNSSFAWWAAYLSTNKKMVLYPENWIQSYSEKIVDLFPSDWIAVN
jgi:hypothetical protein